MIPLDGGFLYDLCGIQFETLGTVRLIQGRLIQVYDCIHAVRIVSLLGNVLNCTLMVLFQAGRRDYELKFQGGRRLKKVRNC